MTAHVKVTPSGHEFDISGHESILEAGLRGGYALDYGCSNGNCGRCIVRVESGVTEPIRHHDFTLSAAAKSQGMILSCCHTARGDLTIEAEEASSASDIPWQEIPLRLRKVERQGNNVLIVNARTPRTRRLRFLAGQSAQLTIADVGTSTYPIASCPCDDMNLQFHVPWDDTDPVAMWLSDAKYNDTVALGGPYGDFVLKESSPNALLFVASGVGFGPVKALIEHAMALDTAPEITLLWKANPTGHYMHNLPRSWDDAFDDFHYVPWDGVLRTEDIQRAVKAHHGDALASTDLYAAVDPSTADAIARYVDTHSLQSTQVHWHKMDFK